MPDGLPEPSRKRLPGLCQYQKYCMGFSSDLQAFFDSETARVRAPPSDARLSAFASGAVGESASRVVV
jgi:hypothetical protein